MRDRHRIGLISDSQSNKAHVGNGKDGAHVNGRPGTLTSMVVNFFASRVAAIQRWLDPRRDLNYECGYPETGHITAEVYQGLFERDHLAARVIELFPKECFQVIPEVYEDEDPEKVTSWEKEFADLFIGVQGVNSYTSQSKGSFFTNLCYQADLQSGIGRYAVVVLGIDDGKDLSQPAEMRPFKGTKKGADGKTPGARSAKGTKPYTAPPFGNEKPSNGIVNNDLFQPVPDYPANDPNNAKVRPDAPAGGATDTSSTPNKTKGSAAKRSVRFARVYSEYYCQILQYDNDPASGRFGLPVRYQVTLGDTSQPGIGSTMPQLTQEVHWTRVVHILGDDKQNNDVFSFPRCQQVLDRILDARKVYGPSAEGYYKSGIPGWAFETSPELGSAELDKAGLKSEWEEFQNSSSKLVATEGGGFKPLVAAIPDPRPHIEIHIEAICIKKGCPIRIFKGSERGELASSQDDGAWNDRLRQRQHFRVTPEIINPIVNRLIDLYCLPEPEDPDGFKTWWPDLESESSTEKASVATQKATAIATFFDPTKALDTKMAPHDFWVDVMGYDDKKAQQLVDGAEKERLRVKAEQEADQQKQQQQQLAVQAQQTQQAHQNNMQIVKTKAKAGIDQAKVLAQGKTQSASVMAQARAQSLMARQAGAADAAQTEQVGGNPDEMAANVFCPTGAGGGVDPSCGKEGAGGSVDVTKTAAFEKHVNGGNPLSSGEPQDMYLHDLANEIGFGGPPKQGTSAEVDAMIAEGGKEMYRGAPHEYQEQLRNGPIFMGKGVYGAGIYAGGGPEARKIAEGYSGGDNRHVVRMVLHPSAKIVTMSKLEDLRDALSDKLRAREKSDHPDMVAAQTQIAARAAEAAKAGDSDALLKITDEYSRITNRPKAERQLLTSDESRTAAHLGYDAIFVEGMNYYVILNRTKLTIQEGKA